MNAFVFQEYNVEGVAVMGLGGHISHHPLRPTLVTEENRRKRGERGRGASFGKLQPAPRPLTPAKTGGGCCSVASNVGRHLENIRQEKKRGMTLVTDNFRTAHTRTKQPPPCTIHCSMTRKTDGRSLRIRLLIGFSWLGAVGSLQVPCWPR